MLQIFKVISFTCVTIFIGFYLFYLVVCLGYTKAKRQKTPTFPENSLKTVSIIIPTYNEAKVIRRRIQNLQALDYPKDKIQVVFVDGGSTDGTAELIEDLAKDSGLTVTIVQQGQRKGFNRAIVEGFAETTGDIICFTGAETEYDSKAVKTMVEKFNDPIIGAVTGKQRIKNVGEGYSPKLETAYRSLYDFLRVAESHIDSPFDIKGEICAARRSVVDNLVRNTLLRGKGCIDCCISFQAKLDGHKTAYEPRAIYYELSPRSVRDSFRQQIRRAVTLIENMLSFKGMILNRRFGAFGMLIMPAHFFMLIILPFILLIGSIGIITVAILDPSNLLSLVLISVSLLAILLSSQLQAFIKTQIVLLIATLKFLIGTETQKFERLVTTRP